MPIPILNPVDDRPPANRAERRAVNNLLIRVNGAKEQVHDPVSLNGVFPVPIDLVRRVLPNKTVSGKPVGSLSPFKPESEFRDFCEDAVKRWLHDMNLRGYKPRTPPDQVLVYGPFPPHDWGGVGRATQMAAAGYSTDQIFDFGVVDFRLRAQFIATRRVVNWNEVEQRYAREGQQRGQRTYALAGAGKPGGTTDDEIMRLLRERDLLIQQAKRRG